MNSTIWYAMIMHSDTKMSLYFPYFTSDHSPKATNMRIINTAATTENQPISMSFVSMVNAFFSSLCPKYLYHHFVYVMYFVVKVSAL